MQSTAKHSLPFCRVLCCFAIQANKAVHDVNDLFDHLNKDYPNLDPAKFIKEMGNSLDQLLTDTLGQTNAFSVVSNLPDASELSAKLPSLLKPVSDAIQTGQKLANSALPSSIKGTTDITKLSEIQKVRESCKELVDWQS